MTVPLDEPTFPPASFSALAEHDAAGPFLVLSGELDLAAAPAVRQAAERLWPWMFDGSTTDGRSAVRIDVGGLSFVDVAGLHVIDDLHHLAVAGGSEVLLARTTLPVRRVMDLCGICAAWAFSVTGPSTLRPLPPPTTDSRRAR